MTAACPEAGKKMCVGGKYIYIYTEYIIIYISSIKLYYSIKLNIYEIYGI